MKFGLFAIFPAVVSAVTFETTGCGGAVAMGSAGHVSFLEVAGYEFVVSTLVINPNLTSISLRMDDNYQFSVRAPPGTQFTDFFIRTEMKGNYILEPVGPGIKFAPGCEGNVTGLTSTDLAPKSLVQGGFTLRDVGNYTIDVTVVQGDNTALYTRYMFLVYEELPDVPTVTPKLVTFPPTASPTKKLPSLAPVAGIPTVSLATTKAPAMSGPTTPPVATTTGVPIAAPVVVGPAPPTGAPVAAPIVVGPVSPTGAPVVVPVAAPAVNPAVALVVPVAVPVTAAPVDLVNQLPPTSPGTSSVRYISIFSVFAFGVLASIMV